MATVAVDQDSVQPSDQCAPVRTQGDLESLLPTGMFARLSPDVLHELTFISALRLLAAVRDPRWHGAVSPIHIDWAAVFAWSRSHGTDASTHLTVELAASMYGSDDARPHLDLLARRLDSEHRIAFLDSLRLAEEGLASEVVDA